MTDINVDSELILKKDLDMRKMSANVMLQFDRLQNAF